MKQPRRRARVEFYRDRSRLHRWRLIAGNGEVVAQGESHPTATTARRSWRTVARIVRAGVRQPAIPGGRRG